MKLKLDENLGERGRVLLARPATTFPPVAVQRMESAPDAALIEACRREGAHW